MTKTQSILLIIFLVIVIIVASIYLYVSTMEFKGTPFEYIIKKGATKSKTPNVGDRYDYGNYGFYSNNRAVNFSALKKGTYDTTVITWDDGTKTLLKDIF